MLAVHVAIEMCELTETVNPQLRKRGRTFSNGRIGTWDLVFLPGLSVLLTREISSRACHPERSRSKCDDGVEGSMQFAVTRNEML